MPTLRVAFRYGDSRLFARLVRFLRGGDSAHVEVSARKVGDMHECISSSHMDGGVRLKIMPLPGQKWRVYKTDIPSARAYDWLAFNDHRGYGWVRLVRFLFPFLRPNVGGPICTTAVGQILGLADSECHDLRSQESAVRFRWGEPE